MTSRASLFSPTVVVWLFVAGATAQAPEPLVITANTRLERGKVYGPIVIAASGIELDGNGAQVVGPDGGRTGVGITAKGQSRVTVRNVTVKGFGIGLRIDGGSNWHLSGCDFSDNFTDPEFGWGEREPAGGVVCKDVADATFEHCQGHRNWDGLQLIDCQRVAVRKCQFAHCSNTGLKLWHTTDSAFLDCDFSYGLRISPGEVHARDSTSVLIESGSDRNHFVRNDCTHGGDGVFVRVLNQWTSVDNVFDGNDTSYANNNGFESWSPRNTYLNNKANHCSYGFWLGGSDKTVLRGNEAGWNGDPNGFHNAPCGFGHAGIVFYGGSASHTVIEDNWCHDNQGGGIVLAADADPARASFRPFHLALQLNKLERNRWGIYLQNVDWIDVGPQTFADNKDGDLFDAGGVTRLVRRQAIEAAKTPLAQVAPVGVLRVGEKAVFDASASQDRGGLKLGCHWDLGDGTVADKVRVEHAFAAPGFYRAGVTVENGSLADVAWVDVYVVDGCDLASDAAQWTWTDDTGRCKAGFAIDRQVALVGGASMKARVDPYDGQRVSLLWPRQKDAVLPLDGRSELVFWLRTIDEYPTGWQDGNPIVTLWQDAEHRLRFVPARDLLQSPQCSEARDGWNRFSVPLAGGELWKREGAAIWRVNWITLGFDSWGAPPLSIWIDGLGFR